VLLAAGAGARLGGKPKSLLELEGIPLIRRQLQALTDAGVGQTVVVSGRYAVPIEAALRGCPFLPVRNPNPDNGQTTSQRLGLAALTGPLDAVIVALADQPLIDAHDIRALIRAFEQRAAGTSVVYPQVAGERGNPVIFVDAVRRQILSAGPGVGCREWQTAHPAAVAPFVTDCRHYKIDIDTADDLEHFVRETGHTLRWPAP